MVKTKLSSNILENLKKLILTNLKEIIVDLNEYLLKNDDLQFDFSNIRIRFLTESNLEFLFFYTIHYSVIINFFSEYFPKEKYAQFFRILKSYDLFNIEHDLLNPQFTHFGALVITYIKKLCEFNEKGDFKSIFPLQFDHELFENNWKAFCLWVSDEPITVKICYPIYNIEIDSDSFIIDEKRNLRFCVPSNKEKEKLVKELNIVPSHFEGLNKAIQRAQAIFSCKAWIKGQVEFTRQEIEKAMIDKDIIHPTHFEEAFHLLGYIDVKVNFLVINNPFSTIKINIKPPFEQSKCFVASSPYFIYPKWMEGYFFSINRDMLIIEQEVKDFLSFYPDYRKNLPDDSIIKLSIMRLTRALKSRMLMDVVLEVVIGIESLLVKGEGSLSLQFRLNTSWLLGLNYKERKKIENFCKYLYKIRNKVVHEGGKMNEIKKITEKIGGIQKVTELSIKLYRLVLLRTIEIKEQKIKFIGREELINRIQKAILGGHFQIEEHELYKRNYDEFIKNLKDI